MPFLTDPIVGFDLLTCRGNIRIPYLHRFISTSGGQLPSVGTEGHAVYNAGMPLEGEQFFSGVNVPHLYSMIITARSQSLAIKTKGQAVDRVGMSRKGKDLLAGFGVP